MKQLFILSIFTISLLAVSCKSKGAEETSESSGAAAGAPKGIAYQVDVPRCDLKWTAYKPTGSVQGIIPVTGGNIYIDGDLITGGSVELNMNGLEVKGMDPEMKGDLESHLKGTIAGKEDDFFNVGKFPTATFTVVSSTKLENDPLGTHMVNGELTIKGITKPVSFKAVVDLSSGVAMKATAEPFMIDRTQWDVKFMSKTFFDNLKDDFVNDQVRIELTLGAVKPAN
jgi:polyisoprenoid-binding protein YceI